MDKLSWIEYRIQMGKIQKIFHINLLKKYIDHQDSQTLTDLVVATMIIEEDKKRHENK